MMRSTAESAFTLIELLMVVAIIAVLAAIAVPNFLEAQVRAKVSRAKADLRTIATGLESYAVDHNHFPPNDGGYNVTPVQLSTPVAYLSTSILSDPFTTKEIIIRPGLDPELAKQYTYTKPVNLGEYNSLIAAGAPSPAVEALDIPTYNLGARARYGEWRILSNGPDRVYSSADYASPDTPWNSPATVLFGADIPYDPTNGTVSWGNILRTQTLAERSKVMP